MVHEHGCGVGSEVLFLIPERKSASSWDSDPKVASRWRRGRQLNKKLEASLRTLEKYNLADRVSACHSTFQPWRCEHGHRWATALESCQLRLCAFEMRSRSMQAQRRWAPTLDGLSKPKYLVLSERNVPFGELSEGIEHLWDSFERLRHLRLWAGRVKGALAVLEVACNREQRSWHPHLNVLFDGPYIEHAALVEAWRTATEQRGRSVWIRRADQGTVRELLKYITKPGDFVDVPEAVEEFLAATWKRRFVRGYGSLYRLRVEPDAAGSLNSGLCPDCRSPRIFDGLPLFPGQVDFDRAGILRPNGQPHPAQALAARAPPGPTHKLLVPGCRGKPARWVEYFQNGWAVPSLTT